MHKAISKLSTRSTVRWVTAGVIGIGISVVSAPIVARQYDDLILIAKKVGDDAAQVMQLSTAELAAFGDQRIQTTTPVTYGIHSFQGPLVRDLIRDLQLEGNTVRLIAYGGSYVIDVPLAEYEEYGAIVAHTMNGIRLTKRLFGPYWVLYPLPADASLGYEKRVYRNGVWHLSTMIVYTKEE